MKILKFTYLLIFSALLMVSACKGTDEEVAPAPSSETAQFSYTIDPDNPNKILFKGEPNVETWYTHWNFGDNTAAEGLEVEKVFYVKGDYKVKFKIFTEGGTAETVQTISIANDLGGSNLIQNGELDDQTSWTILPISAGVDVAFKDGKATWTGGSWGQVGIYQEFDVEANTKYQIQLDVAGSGMTDSWFEVYLGTATPTNGVDYTSGGIRLGLNTWDGCGSEAFDGPLTTLTCSNGGGDGSFEFPNDTKVYLVIRSGGANLGTTGVSIDNITVRKL